MNRGRFLVGATSAAAGAAFFPARARAQTTTLAVTVFNPGVLDAPMVVGLAKGIFAKYQLEITSVQVPTGFEALKKIADGSAQIAAAGGTAVAQTVGQGASLTAICATNGDATGNIPTDPYVAIVARKESDAREGHIEDLRGKKVGVRRTSDFHQYLFSALSAKGIDPNRDVTIVDTTDLLAALQAGTVDAIVSPEPAASRILRAVNGAFLVQRGGNYMQFLELRVVSPRFLAAQPETIKRYLTAFAESAQFVRTHRDETAEIMMQGPLKGTSADVARAAVGFLDPDVRVSRATLDAVRAGSDFAVKIGVLNHMPKPEAMFDPRLVRQVERDHPELFSDLPAIPTALRL